MSKNLFKYNYNKNKNKYNDKDKQTKQKLNLEGGAPMPNKTCTYHKSSRLCTNRPTTNFKNKAIGAKFRRPVYKYRHSRNYLKALLTLLIDNM